MTDVKKKNPEDFEQWWESFKLTSDIARHLYLNDLISWDEYVHRMKKLGFDFIVAPKNNHPNQT